MGGGVKLFHALLAALLVLAIGGLLSSTGPLAPASVEAATCPCSIWAASATPAQASENDTSAVELGVKFRAGTAGQVTAIRFYKGPANSGQHVAHLWSASGALLATATYGGESATGWQQVSLSTPVAVAAGATYVVSYYAPDDGYAQDEGYFSAGGHANGPLTALGDGVDGPNVVYHYGASAFPTDTWDATNHWVDVVFVPTP